MYLSRLIVNLTSREFMRDKADIREMHRTIMSAYQRAANGTPARQRYAVLWRIDPTQRGFVQYVQGAIKPDWTSLPTGYLISPPKSRSLQPAIEAITAGRRLSFRIVANPVRSIEHKKIPLHQPRQQIEWLVRQGERFGFVIPTARNGQPDITPTRCSTLTGRKRTGDNGPLTIEPVRYDGHLIITDPARFTTAFKSGIGRGKAYGCGLLSLAPPRTTGQPET